jgi:hypothetical protein
MKVSISSALKHTVVPIFSLIAELDQYYGDIYSLIIGIAVYDLAN